MFGDESTQLLFNLWGEIGDPCNSTSTAHEYSRASDATNPNIIEWPVLLPKAIQADDREQQKQDLQVLAREGRSMERETHGNDNKCEINSVGQEIAYGSSLHSE